ncbi:Protein arginine N-methyltransferase 1 [Porphyridium purpureum]|uniref:type I protein arginine methyltransferase n=1 Tax=Porphyridium purpureum TaxID=35688 RepID=A0A5J4YRT3_PORPP|nr:Protein arginine N-methyltransferase 1 [Porphyridium purpureum]|eukprot:POR9728..scf236_6
MERRKGESCIVDELEAFVEGHPMVRALVDAPCKSVDELLPVADAGTERGAEEGAADTKSNGHVQDASRPPAQAAAKHEEMTSSDYYFESYAHFGIHEEMLKDEVRTRTYMEAIVSNAHLFKNKVVLDVGCGTGILSMFAVRAGAKEVYAVEMSSIADYARKIFKENNMDSSITLFQGKMEEVQLPSKVDIIISEWMGYFLFYESMMDSLLFARDQWLAPGGLIFPDVCNLYLCAIEDAQYRSEKIDFWDNVYGFRMGCIKDVALLEPLVDFVPSAQVCSNPQAVLSVNLYEMQKHQAAFSVPFELEVFRNDYVHAIVAYFDVQFTHCLRPVGFETGPFARGTHWKQTVFYLDESLAMAQGDKLRGSLACRPNKKNPRDLDIAIDYSMEGEHMQVSSCMRYRLR